MWLASWSLVWVSAGGCVGSYLPSVCVCCVCVYMQLPADFSRLHLADGLHPQVTHVSSSHSGCSITSDSGSSSLSDIYQVRMPPWSCGSPVWTPLDSSREVIKPFLGCVIYTRPYAGMAQHLLRWFQLFLSCLHFEQSNFHRSNSCSNFGETAKGLLSKYWLYYFYKMKW